MTNKSILAQRLTAARQAMKPRVLQLDVANRFKMSPSAASLWESGKTEPSAAQLAELAKWYGVSVDWLLGIEEERSREINLFHAVPIIAETAISDWNLSSSSEILQSEIAYPKNTAAAFKITSDALLSACPRDAFAIVSRGHQIKHNDAVIATLVKGGLPLLRRYVKDGDSELLMADDSRFSTHSVGDEARIIGRITEVVTRKLFL